MSHFGNLVRVIRQSSGLSAPELARRAGISNNALNRLERGLSEPRLSTILALARALGVPPVLLLPLENDHEQ